MENDYDTFAKALELYDYKNIKNPFTCGDTVVLKTGNAPIKVTEIHGSNIKGQYVRTGNLLNIRPASDFKLIAKFNTNEHKEERVEMSMKDKLFKVLDVNRFGIFLTEDGDGKFVLKMSDTNAYEAFDSTNVARVMPYTFSVKFSDTGRSYQYKGKEGCVTVGDVLLSNTGSIAVVEAVNTASDLATKTFAGRKVVTEEF